MGALAARLVQRLAHFPLLRAVARQVLLSSSVVTGKVLQLGNGRGEFVVPIPEAIEDVPPPWLWEGYADDPSEYLDTGRNDVAVMTAILAKYGVTVPRVVLDLGCAAGRMIRHFPAGPDSELWGADINAHHIEWCQQHLPAINFVVVSSAPHLPFADGTFDFVYCGSVFTHITDLADAWLLELRRVLKPGGTAYITLHDLESYEALFTTYADDPLFADFMHETLAFEARYKLRHRKVAKFSFGADPLSQIFYDKDFIAAKWGRWMDVLAYEPQVHDHQSALLLRKG